MRMHRPALKRRFLMIDPSITDFRGHYHHYALHCLRAADGMGYDTVLATNRRNQTESDFPWRVVPAYRNDFWSNYKYDSVINYVYERFLASNFKVQMSMALRFLGPLVIRRILDSGSIAQFADDTASLLGELGPGGDGDVVFVPTAGLTELLGVAELSRRGGAAPGGAWHLLFRTTIHVGSPYGHSFTYVKLRLLRMAFARFLQRSRLRSFLWTDSDQLTSEYNLISDAFSTLPIPHTEPRPAEDPGRSPLTVSYLGDARSEKGYQHLPHAVRDVWESHVRTGAVRFVIQSNYNLPDGEPATVVARSQLEAAAEPGILDLITEPMDPDRYAEVLAGSDALLLPYDPVNYYARSSGICVEALARGTPVIAPAGSWIARQFLAEFYGHQASLGNAGSARSLSSGSLDVRLDHEDGRAAPAGSPVLLDAGSQLAYFWTSVGREVEGSRGPAGGAPTHMLVRIEFDADGVVPTLGLRVAQYTASKLLLSASDHLLEKAAGAPYATCLVRIRAGAELIRAGIKNKHTETTVRLNDVPASALRPPGRSYQIARVSARISDVSASLLFAPRGSKSPPRGSVGLVYDSPSEISSCIADLADNYRHYASTARRFSDAYYARHNARNLVATLEGRGGGAAAAGRAGGGA